MPGIPQWSKNVEVAANPSIRVRYLELDFSDQINSSGNHLVDVFAPEGFISRIKGVTLVWPTIAGATSGTYGVYVLSASAKVGLFYGVANYDTELRFTSGNWVNEMTDAAPSDSAGQYQAMQSGVFDVDDGMRIIFENETDANDTGSSKILRLWLEEEKIS